MTQLKNAKVLVTGVSGYVGAHVAQQLLSHGYSVRGTVRSTKSAPRIDKLRIQITASLPTEGLPELEFVQADLLNAEDWPAAIAGCQYICHVASPFPTEIPSDENVLIKPALDGTLNVLKAAADDGNVKRIVLTSSLAAIHDVKTAYDPEKIYNEDDWVDPDQVEAYSKSKILAEKAAWKFIEELPQVDGKRKLELVAINPSYVLGPLIADNISSSVAGLKKLLAGPLATPLVPKFHMPICDVRDVALAHVKALEGTEHVGKRYMIVTGSQWMKDVARTLQKEFKPLGYFVPTVVAPNTLVWMSSFYDRSNAMVVPRLDKEFKLDNRRMVEELKITPTEIDQTIIDTIHSLIERGIMKETKKYKKSRQPAAGKLEGDESMTTGDQPAAAEALAAGDVASQPASQPQEVKSES